MLFPPKLAEPARAIATVLVERRQTLAVAESSAGGLISASLLSVPGASAFYLGGAVIYTVEVSKALLAGAVPVRADVRGASDAFARFLATAVATTVGTDWGVSETGATGPGANPYGDPPGHAWVATAGPGGVVESQHVLTGGDVRDANMVTFAAAALGLLLRNLSAGRN